MSDNSRAWWRHRNLGVRHELRLSSGRLAYFDVGAGAPLVFLHGPLTNANVWRKVIGALSSRYRCIVLDLPFGSHAIPMPAADLSFGGLSRLVAEALDELDVRGATVIGNDGGTPLAQLLAISRPDLAGRLVLTAGGAYDNAPPRAFRPILAAVAYAPAARLFVLGPLRLRAMRRLPVSYGGLTRRPVEPATSDSWALPALVNDDIYADLRRMLRALDGAEVEAVSRRLHEFTGPVLVVWSKPDRVFPHAHAERLASDFADSRLAWIPDSGSLIPEEKPFELSDLIANFAPRPSARPAVADRQSLPSKG
ncbi:alpha/beta fold hydrolase [Nocardia sp. NPDC005825]|uniref:alpha/beta fold hydrolase n=1 Tax=unclassified Nocardia TaxID=2637762 RepID=UPI0033C70024